MLWHRDVEGGPPQSTLPANAVTLCQAYPRRGRPGSAFPGRSESMVLAEPIYTDETSVYSDHQPGAH